jgi:hypothetical protein
VSLQQTGRDAVSQAQPKGEELIASEKRRGVKE